MGTQIGEVRRRHVTLRAERRAQPASRAACRSCVSRAGEPAGSFGRGFPPVLASGGGRKPIGFWRNVIDVDYP